VRSSSPRNPLLVSFPSGDCAVCSTGDAGSSKGFSLLGDGNRIGTCDAWLMP
jgi:hypothetical protein